MDEKYELVSLNKNRLLRWLFPRSYNNQTLQYFNRVTKVTKINQFIEVEGY